MADIEKDTPKVLDDLRQKRLAYFESGGSAQCSQNDAKENKSTTGINWKSLSHPAIPVGIPTLDSQGESKNRDEEDLVKACIYSENISDKMPNEYSSMKQFKTFTTGDTESMQRSEDKSAHHTSESIKDSKSNNVFHSVPMKTSSFYLSSPYKKESQIIESDGKNNGELTSVVEPSSRHPIPTHIEVTRESGGQEDGYNETVERLIKATKDELLGLKSSDDIWTSIRKTPLAGSTSTLDSIPVQAKANIIETTQENVSNKQEINEVRSFKQQWQSNSESFANEYLSASMSNIHDAEKVKKPKLFSQNSVPVGATHYGLEMHPVESKVDPPFTRYPKPNQDMHKSLNTKTLEELFSSKQHVSGSVAVHNGNIQGSQEFEKAIPSLPVHQQSLDFSDLGLSTHRPESDRKEHVKVDADDLNLGDTVSQELRTLLGEEKFQQFLVKSKRDLDDLHQDKMSDISDGSARKDKTPRLLKDRSSIPKKPNTPSSDRKPLKSSTDILKKKPTNQKDIPQTNTPKEKDKPNVAIKPENTAKKSEEFTPRTPDGEVVNSLIGKYVLNKTDVDPKFVSNPAQKAKSKAVELKEGNIMPPPKPVPDLNLEALQEDSPRPKLNRPKYEPHTIYSETQKAEHSDRESVSNSSEDKPSPGRNYEQVVVSRNVAFSASEIYHQAYGVNFASQARTVPMSPSVLNRGQQHIQFAGSHYSAPLTPKTPSGSAPAAESLGYSPYQNNMQGQIYPPVSGLTYHGMPQTLTTPQEPVPQMFATREEEASLKQYIANTQFRSMAAENTQSSNQPVAYGPYSQMFGMMSDFRGYPLHSGRMDPPTGFTPPTGMTTPTNMVQPKGMPTPAMHASVNVMPASYPMNMVQSVSMPSSYNTTPPTVTTPTFSGPLASLDQPLHMPHPPVSTATGQQFSQPSGTTVFSSPQGVPIAYPYPYPVMVMAPHPPGDPPATPSQVQFQTPRMSHAEVQTELEVEKPALDDKVTLVEESTFTSVSQIKVDDDILVPHPPSTKKGSRSSPRKPPAVNPAKKGQQTKRHIEGIRQHHEQRRQQQEEGKMSEEQLVEKQRKFAKQSLERYFSSLENLYMASNKVSKNPSEEPLPKADIESEEETEEPLPDTDRTKEDDGIVDDVTSETNVPRANQFNFVVPGFMDFTEFQTDPVVTKEVLKLNLDNNVNRSEAKEDEVSENIDYETVVNSEVTGVSIKAGGLTDRLRDIGIDVHSREHEDGRTNETNKSAEIVGKKQEGKRGKVLIVCPECQGLNKEYMSWCTHCGEIIIGVEPMLVSKNKEGKIRMKPLEKSQLKSQTQVANDIHISVEDSRESKQNIPVLDKVEDEEELEKPFNLNLEVIKSPVKDSNETYNISPSKSDGKDSGRPSSDDNDLLNYKIEQEVVNDICETITDPVLKGYVKSHFAKKSHAVLEKNKDRLFMPESLIPTKQDIVLARVDSEMINDQGAANKKVEPDLHDKSHIPERMNEVGDKMTFTVEAKAATSNKFIEPAVDKQEPAYEVFNATEKSTHFHQMKSENSVTKLVAQFDKNTHIQSHSNTAISDKITSAPYEKEVVTRLPSVEEKHYHEEEKYESNMNSMVDISKEFGTGKQQPAVDSETINKEEDSFPIPPPIPNFSVAAPVPRTDLDELRIKIPLNSMDFSEDFSQADSIVIDNTNAEEMKKAEKKKQAREERRQERRRNRGHGAIDVEVFGYEETRESRNSSRGLRLVPILNLAGSSSEEEDWGNSSDEDDMSVQSDIKPEVKVDVSDKIDPGYQPSNAWEQDAIPEYPDVIEELQEMPEGSGFSQTVMGPAGDAFEARSLPEPQQYTSNYEAPEMSTSIYGEKSMQNHGLSEDHKEDWKHLFDPDSPEFDDIPDDPDDTFIPDLDQPLLEQVLNQPQPKKSKQRPKSSGSRKVVKSKVRKSIEEPGYQRKWARSSLAWSSYNQGEINTASSLQSSGDFSHGRPASASRVRNADSTDTSSPARAAPKKPVRPLSADVYKRAGSDSSRGRSTSASRERQSIDNTDTRSPTHTAAKKPARPVSADLFKRKQSKQKKSKKEPVDLDSDRASDMIEHRLPRPGGLDRLIERPEVPEPSERMASPSSTYDKYLQMTPRIEAGTVSKWQCLPDEILLHIFAYLDQVTLTQCAQVCHQFYRVAMDETLWKYITIKKKADLDDNCLMEVSKRHPVSLALIQCHGDQVTARGLRDLFRECADFLKELNVGWCSRGALHGDSILLHAAARCRNITHLDTSWCNVTDSGLMAIANCCNRLESLCISGCQAVSNDGLETVIKKHGPHLRVLEMFGCFNIAPRGLRCISNNCINLVSLNLGQCYKLTDSCIAQLSSSLGRVETLDLRGLKQIKDNCMRRVVKNCTRLKHLSLANCPGISDVSVLEIATYLTDIRSVDLCGCKNVTDSSVRALVNTCTNLRNIDISSTGCTHRSVSMVANFCGQRLETLKINFLSDVTEQCLIKLAKHCVKLQSVHMYGCTSIRNMDKITKERPTFTIEM